MSENIRLTTDADKSRLRHSLEMGECLRCGKLFETRRLLCARCGTPNFLARPRFSIVITISPCLLLVAFFLAFRTTTQAGTRLGDFMNRGAVIAAVLFVGSVFFAFWTAHSAKRIRRVKRRLLDEQ